MKKKHYMENCIDEIESQKLPQVCSDFFWNYALQKHSQLAVKKD